MPASARSPEERSAQRERRFHGRDRSGEPWERYVRVAPRKPATGRTGS